MAEKMTCEELTGELVKYMKSNCSRLPVGEVRIEGCALPRAFNQYLEDIKNFEVRSDDVWVLSYPKCGTTWTLEMVWLLVNKCDFETAKKYKIHERAPFIEFIGIGGAKENNTIEQANKAASPRVIKCHLPVQLLPKQLFTKKPKMVYVYRDPRDAAISYFYHMQLWYNYTGTQEQLIDAFLQQILPYDPFWDHVIKFWEVKDQLNICFNTFEDMKADLGHIIEKTSEYLAITISPENKQKLIEHLSFKSMQTNDSVNYKSDMENCKFKDVQFIREGKSGGWKSKLSKEHIKKFDEQANKYIKGKNFPYYKPASD